MERMFVSGVFAQRGNPTVTCRIDLEKTWFAAKERQIVQCGEFSASTFVYSTGVEAIRIRNSRGEVVMLPYQGQQIWEFSFDNRDRKMYCLFEEPRPADLIVDTYGAFMHHCGALRIGNPGPGDDHPMHGELPCAKYGAAALVLGSDDQGEFFGLTGTFNYKKGFGDFYDATPRVVLRPGLATIDMSMRIENVGNCPMDLMYMAHFNFRLCVRDCRIVQTTGWSADDMVLRAGVPPHIRPTPEFLALMDKLAADPGITEIIRESDVYEQEVLFNLRNMRPGRDGLAHVLVVHADGTADSVAYDPAVLNRHCRWIIKNRNLRVIGILPATAESEGYAAEKKKGNVRTLDPGGIAAFEVRAGMLSRAEADAALRGI